ncbi:MAG: tetratricopeptide repeat protein [Rhodobacteraceae bacterium]|nr:tetratricopeptide repeat protein [Paracoccaceae bacterium]
MASEDSFIDEVAEEVRRDRLFGYLRRYGWIAITLVILLVGGAAYNEYRKALLRSEAQQRGDAILTALEVEDIEARIRALSSLTAEGETGALLALLAAAEAVGSDDEGAALARLEQVASDPEVAPAYRDLASLHLIMLQGDAMDPEARLERLVALTLPGAPYRPLALEQTAIAYLDQGKPELALSTLQELVAEEGATQGLRRRASQLIVALGGSQAGI